MSTKNRKETVTLGWDYDCILYKVVFVTATPKGVEGGFSA